SLYGAGAWAEALAEIKEVRSNLSGKEKIQATVFLTTHYVASYAKANTKAMVESLQDMGPGGLILPALPERKHSLLIAYGAEWSGAELTPKNRDQVMAEAVRFSVRAPASVKQWFA